MDYYNIRLSLNGFFTQLQSMYEAFVELETRLQTEINFISKMKSIPLGEISPKINIQQYGDLQVIWNYLERRLQARFEICSTFLRTLKNYHENIFQYMLRLETIESRKVHFLSTQPSIFELWLLDIEKYAYAGLQFSKVSPNQNEIVWFCGYNANGERKFLANYPTKMEPLSARTIAETILQYRNRVYVHQQRHLSIFFSSIQNFLTNSNTSSPKSSCSNFNRYFFISSIIYHHYQDAIENLTTRLATPKPDWRTTETENLTYITMKNMILEKISYNDVVNVSYIGRGTYYTFPFDLFQIRLLTIALEDLFDIEVGSPEQLRAIINKMYGINEITTSLKILSLQAGVNYINRLHNSARLSYRDFVNLPLAH